MKYSTKALTVDAMQYLADKNWPAFQKFMQVSGLDSPPVVLSISTRNGLMKLTSRDWVIRDEHGDFWPLTQSAFNAIFTEANTLDHIRNDMNKELFTNGVPDYDAGL